MLALWYQEAGKVEDSMKIIINRLQRQKAGVFIENCFYKIIILYQKHREKKSWSETTPYIIPTVDNKNSIC